MAEYGRSRVVNEKSRQRWSFVEKSRRNSQKRFQQRLQQRLRKPQKHFECVLSFERHAARQGPRALSRLLGTIRRTLLEVRPDLSI